MAERYRIDPNEIKVGERFRKDSGDLSKLMKSMDRQGLLHPLVVSEDGWLICGFRRLEAAKWLHWTHVEVKTFYGEWDLQAEHDENECRLNSLPQSESLSRERSRNELANDGES